MEDVKDLGNSNGGCIPDTGSVLTHGSTVVLAGNMGAAMRQRKKTDRITSAGAPNV